MRLIDRRIGLLFALFLAALLLAVTRAAWLGGVRASDLRERARAQQVDQLTVAARRGTITDRNGRVLAVSEDAITVFANPFLIDDPARAGQKLAPLLDRPAPELQALLGDRAKGFVYLRRKIPAAAGERVKKLDLEGVGTVSEPKRRYPQGKLAAQLLGAVGTDNNALAGIEQSRDDRLHGTDGKRRVVKDALGEPVSIVEMKRSEPGADIRLTIDSGLQARTEQVIGEVGKAFAARGATAVVLDPRNGEVLALANWPAVDANRFGEYPPEVRQNRAVAASFEPGSTFKAFTVAGALEDRLIRPETKFDLPPTIEVADRTIEESTPRGGVRLTVAEILAQSSNVGSVKIGLALGKERFDRWVRRFGFGSPTRVELPGEAPGIVPRPAQYSGSSLGNLPIGQGLAVTAVQMAAGYSAIANRGLLREPHVVAGDRPPARRVVRTPTARRVAEMLKGVLAEGGTAPEAAVEGYELAGKTGTAEKPNGKGGYSKTKYVASFIGFAPARSPKLLVSVAVDEPKGSIYGGEVAAPAFERIVTFALPYLRIGPGWARDPAG